MRSDIRVWLTKKGAGQSDRKIPAYTEGLVMEIEAHYPEENPKVRVKWSNGEWGRYFWNDGRITRFKPKPLRKVK